MSTIRFDDSWSYNSCRVLRLENDLLRVDVLPECGGKILHLVHKPEDRDYLWQHPSIKPAILPNACNYDDNFCGGWDDCFPSVAPGTHKGEVYPDHGEYWTRRFDWQADRTADAITLYLRADGGVTPTRFEKWITLSAGTSVVKIRHRISHLGDHPLDFQWSQHPAIRVGPTHEFIVPVGAGVIGSPGMARLADEALSFRWPDVPGQGGGSFDYRKVPASTDRPGFEMLYLHELKGGWYGVIDRATQSGFGLAFDRSVFKSLWLFASYGGWRGLRLAILEPATGWPYDLGEASAAGRCGPLMPGQIIDTTTSAVIAVGDDAIQTLESNGT